VRGAIVEGGVIVEIEGDSGRSLYPRQDRGAQGHSRGHLRGINAVMGKRKVVIGKDPERREQKTKRRDKSEGGGREGSRNEAPIEHLHIPFHARAHARLVVDTFIAMNATSLELVPARQALVIIDTEKPLAVLHLLHPSAPAQLDNVLATTIAQDQALDLALLIVYPVERNTTNDRSHLFRFNDTTKRTITLLALLSNTSHQLRLLTTTDDTDIRCQCTRI